MGGTGGQQKGRSSREKSVCIDPGIGGLLGLRLHLTYVLPNSLEGPPSYKPPTPKAKLEEPEMVSTSPGAQAAPSSTPPPFPTEAGARRGNSWERPAVRGS